MADVSHLGSGDDVAARGISSRRWAWRPCRARRSSPSRSTAPTCCGSRSCKKLATLEAAGERLVAPATHLRSAARSSHARPRDASAGGEDAGRVERGLQPALDLGSGNAPGPETAAPRIDRRDAAQRRRRARGAVSSAHRSRRDRTQAARRRAARSSRSRPRTISARRRRRTARLDHDRRVGDRAAAGTPASIHGTTSGPPTRAAASAPDLLRPALEPHAHAVGRGEHRGRQRHRLEQSPAERQAAVRRVTSVRAACGSGRTFSATCTITPSVPSEPVGSRCRS